MSTIRSRRILLASTVLGLGLAMFAAQPAKADSVCVGSIIGPTMAADCTDPNGNGRAEATFGPGGASLLLADPAAVVFFGGLPGFDDFTTGLTTGYIESTTAGRGVLRIDSSSPFTYVGTGSTLVGQAGATGATILSITAPSVTLNSGNITSLGAGSTALLVTANGGAGSGGINATIDGDIVSMGGPAIDLNQTNAAATGNILLTSTAGSTITSIPGDAVNISSAGAGTITVNLADSVSATGGDGIQIANGANGGDISVTTAAVHAGGIGASAITIDSNSTTADVTIIANGALDGTQSGVSARILDPTSTGNLSITTNAAVDASVVGIFADNLGNGSTSVTAVGPVSAGSNDGILARTFGGPVTVSAGAVTSTLGTAIFAQQGDATGSGDISVTTTGALSGTAGINAINSGAGGITVAIGGDVNSTGGQAVALNQPNVAATGNILLTSTAGSSITSLGGDAVNISGAGTGTITVGLADSVSATGGDGIQITNGVAGGNISVTTAAVHGGGAGADAINVQSSSTTADVTIVANGAVDGTFDAIDADILAPAATGNLSVTANAAVTGMTGIDARNAGTGTVTVNTTGPVTGTVGDGVFANSSGGNVTVTAGAVIGAGTGITAWQSLGAGTGAISVTTTGAVTGLDGINALNAGLGPTTVTTGAGLVSGTNGSAVIANNTNAASTGNVSVTVGAGGATASGDAIQASTLGTGDVTVNSSGPITSTGGRGIVTFADTGATVVNITGASTTGVGVDILGSGPVTFTNSGTITTTGPGSTGVNISAAGPITATLGNISTAAAPGALVQGTACNPINILATGNISAPAGTALFTSGPCAITVTQSAGTTISGFGGITVFAGTGATININGSVTGTSGTAIGSAGAGPTTLNIGSTGQVTGAINLGPNNDTVNNSGIFNATGTSNFQAGSDVFNNNASGIINVAAGTSFAGLETLTNAGTINAASGLTFDLGNTAMTNTGTFNLAGTVDFGAGTDSFANTGAGILNLTGNASILNTETFTQSGRINLNTFVLTGPPIAFINTGTIDTNGAAGLGGFTSFNNAGILDLGPGPFAAPAGVVFTNSGTILADEGASSINGQSSFANTGTIDLQDGAVGDVLTINSAFVGSGGSNLDIDFTATAADLLIINGAASGSTAVDANFLGGGLLINLDGVLVVDTTSATANAFVLGSVTGETPLIDVSLVQEGADFFLVTAPTAAAFNPLAIPVFATSLWYQSADEVIAETRKPATTTGLSFWGEGYYHDDEFGDDDTVVLDGVPFEVDNEMETKRHGIQLGVDYGFGGGRVGLTGGYAWANGDNDGDIGLDAKGWNIGVYGQFGGITGFHGEFLLKHDRYDAEFDDGVFDGEEFDIRETGIDGAVGYRFGIGGDAHVDANVGLSHVRTKVDDIDAFGLSYDIGKLTSTRGRAGLRATFGGGLSPYIDGTVYREFDGDGEVELFDGVNSFDLDTEGKGTWVRLEAGLSGNNGPGPILAAWADFLDREGFGIRAGWRLGGRVAEAAPPPPPPPPPPPALPPATQTCPDGSVILATDACPPPPPPPPPPPEPERG